MQEIRADAHAAAGAAAEARTAYEEAIAAAGPGSGYVELLRAKLNDVAAGQLVSCSASNVTYRVAAAVPGGVSACSPYGPI
ncbi:MAG: tetratricopeptide repeat protein [Gammaproteobacteria bacterium]|nr:tetratricopeptide repeat protein [Gammaproteobacteria bacterium]